jgi:hypothetical protein
LFITIAIVTDFRWLFALSEEASKAKSKEGGSVERDYPALIQLLVKMGPKHSLRGGRDLA